MSTPNNGPVPVLEVRQKYVELMEKMYMAAGFYEMLSLYHEERKLVWISQFVDVTLAMKRQRAESEMAKAEYTREHDEMKSLCEEAIDMVYTLQLPY